MNRTPKELLKSCILANAGLILFGCGVYLAIQANIGAAPWDVFHIGLSKTFGILYGSASIIVSLSIVLLDILLKEKIGLGTVFDAIVVGKTVDFLNYLNLVSTEHTLPVSFLLLFAGFFLEGFSQYLYMKAALSCGPRDAFQVALGRKMPKIPIGAVNVIILLFALAAGWLLGGPVGIGTLIAPFGIGLMQQLAFNMMKFDPKSVEHQGLKQSIKVLFGK